MDILETLFFSLIEPLSKIDLDTKTSILFLVIIYGLIQFYKLHKHTKKELKKIREVLNKKLEDCEEKLENCEEKLKNCEKGRLYILNLHNSLKQKCEELEKKLGEFINSK